MAAIIETSHISHCGQEAGCPCSGLTMKQSCQLCAQNTNAVLGLCAVQEDSIVECQQDTWGALAPLCDSYALEELCLPLVMKSKLAVSRLSYPGRS